MALTKKTFNLSDRSANALGHIIEADGYNETDTINRALVLNAALLDYMNNGALTIVDAEGNHVKVVLL